MKKFKIKNRQKRKYVRKIAAPSETSFSRTLPIGLLPMLLIGIAILMNAFISTQPVDQFLGTISLPKLTISFPTLLFPHTHNNQEHLFTAFSNLTYPIFMTIPQAVIQFFSSLNPNPALEATGKGIDATNIWIVNSVLQSVINLDHLVSTEIQSLGSFIASFTTHSAQWIWMLLIQTFTVIIKTSVFLFFAIIHGVQIALAAILSFLIAIWQGINAFIDAVIYWIALPFRIVGGYLVATKPFFLAFGKLIGQSGNELVGGFNALGSATGEIMKLSKGQ